MRGSDPRPLLDGKQGFANGAPPYSRPETDWFRAAHWAGVTAVMGGWEARDWRGDERTVGEDRSARRARDEKDMMSATLSLWGTGNTRRVKSRRVIVDGRGRGWG